MSPPPPPGIRPDPKTWAQRVSPLVYIEDNELPHSNRGTTLLVGLALACVGAGVWLMLASQSSSAHWSPAPAPALSPVATREAGEGRRETARAPLPPPASRLPAESDTEVDLAPTPVAKAPVRAPASAAAPAAKKPAPAPARPVVESEPSEAPPVLPVEPSGPPVEPALLSVSAWPWGSLSVDGRPSGETPVLDLPITPGTHRLRIEREGFQPFERIITVTSGQKIRITGIALEERSK